MAYSNFTLSKVKADFGIVTNAAQSHAAGSLALVDIELAPPQHTSTRLASRLEVQSLKLPLSYSELSKQFLFIAYKLNIVRAALGSDRLLLT